MNGHFCTAQSLTDFLHWDCILWNTQILIFGYWNIRMIGSGWSLKKSVSVRWHRTVWDCHHAKPFWDNQASIHLFNLDSIPYQISRNNVSYLYATLITWKQFLNSPINWPLSRYYIGHSEDENNIHVPLSWTISTAVREAHHSTRPTLLNATSCHSNGSLSQMFFLIVLIMWDDGKLTRTHNYDPSS